MADQNLTTRYMFSDFSHKLSESSESGAVSIYISYRLSLIVYITTGILFLANILWVSTVFVHSITLYEGRKPDLWLHLKSVLTKHKGSADST